MSKLRCLRDDLINRAHSGRAGGIAIQAGDRVHSGKARGIATRAREISLSISHAPSPSRIEKNKKCVMLEPLSYQSDQ